MTAGTTREKRSFLFYFEWSWGHLRVGADYRQHAPYDTTPSYNTNYPDCDRSTTQSHADRISADLDQRRESG